MNKDLMEILTVKEKASVFELTTCLSSSVLHKKIVSIFTVCLENGEKLK